MAKIKLEYLNKDSTPCEICVAINSREVELDESKNYFDEEYCTTRFYNSMSVGGSGCTDADKAMIKLLYLNSAMIKLLYLNSSL